MKKSILNHVGRVLFIALLALFMMSCRNREIDKTLVEYTFPGECITDGHIDGLVRFADANTIVTMTEDDYSEMYDYTPKGDYRKVINAKNANGERYNIVTLPITEDVVEWHGCRANYLNYYAGNKVVLVPVYEDVMDAEALRILGEIYPDKEIIPVNGEVLGVLGGGIHCVTQQQPDFGNITYRN